MAYPRPPYPYRHDIQFAYSRGWKVTPHAKRFTLEELRIGRPPTPPDSLKESLQELHSEAERHLYRAQYFQKWHYGQWLPMAIVAHPFNAHLDGWSHHPSSLPFDEHAAWAALHGLLARQLPYSWRNPVGIGVLYMRAHTDIEDTEHR